MRILVVNCNTSVAMTESIVAAARLMASPGTEIIGGTPTWGVASAEGYFDSFISAASVLDLLSSTTVDFDACVMAGFGEHGREGARQLLDVPVVDITEAAVMLANLVGQSFGVVTTLSSTIDQIRHSLVTAGLFGRCAGVVATDLPVLALHDDLDRTVEAFALESRALIARGAEVIVLGCAGMAGLHERLSAQLDVPVVDGVSAAVGLCETLVKQGLRTSKIGAFARPDLTKMTRSVQVIATLPAERAAAGVAG